VALAFIALLLGRVRTVDGFDDVGGLGLKPPNESK
jgi:hypothetical protein